MTAYPETELIIPPDHATGCNPRRSIYGDVCKLLADDRIDVIPQDQWESLIATQHAHEYVAVILDQGSVGSCATESTTGTVMLDRKARGLEHVLLNPWFIYNSTSGGSDSGSSIDENLVFARERGIAPESVWPRSKGWQATPSAEAYTAALDYQIKEFYDLGSIQEVGSALLQGFPVVFGWQGHSCYLVRLLNATTAEYVNSWGATWNGNGRGQIKLSSINFGYGAWALRCGELTGQSPPVPLAT